MPFPLLPKLRLQQQRMIEAIEAIAVLAAGPYPDSVEKLAELRWAFTRDMLAHFASVEKELLQPLMADRRPEVAAAAARSSQDLAQVYGHFHRHAKHWHGLPAPNQWQDYRRAIAVLARLMAVRIMAQEQAIYPLLPAQHGGPAPVSAMPPLNYPAEAWKIRDLIYRGLTGNRVAVA